MKIKNLHLAFGSTVVLDSINMEVPEGGITALLGANGSGKTSLLRYLYGELKPITGELIFEGQSWDPGKPDWKQLIGVVPDDDALFPDLSPQEHLDLAATVYGITEPEAQGRSALLLQLFDLETKKNTFCMELSAGMRKRVALALALIHAPRLLLMDEPLNALDYESGETFFRLLTFLKSKGRTVIVSGHHHAALLTVADHVIEIGRKQLCTSMSLGTENRNIEALLATLRAPGEVQMESELLTWFCP